MAYTTIDKSEDYFKVVTYSGSGSTGQTITVGFQPDIIWVKARNNTYDHVLFDSVRGFSTSTTGKQISPNLTNAQASTTGGHVGTVTSTGWTTKNGTAGTSLANVGDGSTTYVCYNWKVNAGSTATNDTGNIDTTVQANTTAGISIVQWEGANSTATLGHGLGAVPEMIISKCIDTTQEWGVYHRYVGNDDYLHLNENAAEQDNAAYWNDTTPTSTVWSVGNSGPTNDNGDTMIAYVFTPIQGFSKFGMYKGNCNADGTFVYTGFKPAWVMQKRINNSTDAHWHKFDIKRDTTNPRLTRLEGNNDFGDSTGEGADFLSNGFKWRSNDVRYNGSSDTYIYMAFAEHPFVSSEGVPCTAR